MARRARRRQNGTQSGLHGAAGLHTRGPHVRPSDVPQPADRWPSGRGAVCARGLRSFLRQLSKLHRLEENIGAAAVALTSEDLRDIENAASKIAVQGARHPEHIERMSNL